MAKLTVQNKLLYLGSRLLKGELGFNYFYGIQDALNSTSLETYGYASEFSRMASYGVKVIRIPLTPMWPNDWSTVIGTTTPSNASYYTILDAILDAAASNGISVIGTLFWRFATIPDLKTEGLAQLGNKSSTTRSYMTSFITEIVTRYKDHAALGGWELFNEAELFAETSISNWSSGLINTAKGTPASYSDPTDTFTLTHFYELVSTYTALIRSIDNSSVLVLKGTGGGQPLITKQSYWARKQFSNSRYSDHIDTHLYSYIDFVGKDITQSGPYLKRMIREGRNKPLIVSEFGVNSTYDIDDTTATKRVIKAYAIIKQFASLALQWQWSVYDTSFGVHPTTSRSSGQLSARTSGASFQSPNYPDPKNGPPHSSCMRAVGGATTGINISTTSILNPSTFTVMCWGKLVASTTATARKLLMKGNGTNNGWRLILLPGSDRSPGSVYAEMKTTDGTNKATTTSDTGPSYWKWAHHAITFDGTYMLKWRDGLSVGNKLDFTGKSWLPSSNDFRIGSNAGSEPWDGFISDVQFYNRVLTSDEINSAMSGNTLSGLIGHWKLDGNALDSSGNNNHGTPEASVQWVNI